MVLLCELRTALADCKFELESLKHQFEAVCPGKVSIEALRAANHLFSSTKILTFQTLNVPLSLINTPDIKQEILEDSMNVDELSQTPTM